MQIIEELKGATFYTIPKLQEEDIVVISISNMFAPCQFQELREELNKMFPNNKWLVLFGEESNIKIQKEEDGR